jgi:hypothetical protein
MLKYDIMNCSQTKSNITSKLIEALRYLMYFLISRIPELTAIPLCFYTTSVSIVWKPSQWLNFQWYGTTAKSRVIDCGGKYTKTAIP